MNYVNTFRENANANNLYEIQYTEWLADVAYSGIDNC